jgi:hypothetical protein
LQIILYVCEVEAHHDKERKKVEGAKKVLHHIPIKEL